MFAQIVPNACRWTMVALGLTLPAGAALAQSGALANPAALNEKAPPVYSSGGASTPRTRRAATPRSRRSD